MFKREENSEIQKDQRGKDGNSNTECLKPKKIMNQDAFKGDCRALGNEAQSGTWVERGQLTKA